MDNTKHTHGNDRFFCITGVEHGWSNPVYKQNVLNTMRDSTTVCQILHGIDIEQGETPMIILKSIPAVNDEIQVVIKVYSKYGSPRTVRDTLRLTTDIKKYINEEQTYYEQLTNSIKWRSRS